MTTAPSASVAAVYAPVVGNRRNSPCWKTTGRYSKRNWNRDSNTRGGLLRADHNAPVAAAGHNQRRLPHDRAESGTSGGVTVHAYGRRRLTVYRPLRYTGVGNFTVKVPAPLCGLDVRRL